MGISGLIPFLEKASSKVYLKDLRGVTVAVDTYCWLHKGAFGCAEKLVRGEDTDQYIQYCLKYINMLQSYDIKPILVFDGQHLPAKALTEQRRRDSRQQSKKRAAELLRLGRTHEARSQMRRCVDITHEMALRLICECHKRHVDCIVAPYEADAQMAWFTKVDIAHYIVTEDSDLMLFGARKVIFKLDLTGAGLLVDADKLYLAMGCKQKQYNFEKFRRMCILSGCDYLDSLPGIGLAKACKFILKTTNENEEIDMWKTLRRMPQYLNMTNLKVTDAYIDDFLKAEATFRHMYIYNPIERRMERLNTLSEYGTELCYCSNAGTLLDDSEQALQLALGNLNPFTLKQLCNWHPDDEPLPKNAKFKSIWQQNYTRTGQCSITPKKDKCALFFKKVDFISKSIDKEIEANIARENAKPEEDEVFCLYKYGAIKRKRYASESAAEDEQQQQQKLQMCTPPTSPIQAKTRYNPFAKEGCTDEQQEQQLKHSPIVCKNPSLLRLLSPKKLQIECNRLATHKRSIFADSSKESVVATQVRSRFFATNLEQVTKQQTDTCYVDLSSEIDKIEALKKLQGSQLYSVNRQQQPQTNADNIQNFSDSDVDSVASTIAGSSGQMTITIDKQETTKLGVLIISDDSNDTEMTLISSATSTSTVDNNATGSIMKEFQMRSVPRLGLSKPKTSALRGKNKKAAKIGKSSEVPKSQLSLSMFGFQKRPLLE